MPNRSNAKIDKMVKLSDVIRTIEEMSVFAAPLTSELYTRFFESVPVEQLIRNSGKLAVAKAVELLEKTYAS